MKVLFATTNPAKIKSYAKELKKNGIELITIKDLNLNIEIDENVDFLIKDIEMFGCTNHPNAWNKLRAIWMTANESSNITTDKKKQLKQFLMLKGLTMHYQDSKVIDNYKG